MFLLWLAASRFVGDIIVDAMLFATRTTGRLMYGTARLLWQRTIGTSKDDNALLRRSDLNALEKDLQDIHSMLRQQQSLTFSAAANGRRRASC